MIIIIKNVVNFGLKSVVFNSELNLGQ